MSTVSSSDKPSNMSAPYCVQSKPSIPGSSIRRPFSGWAYKNVLNLSDAPASFFRFIGIRVNLFFCAVFTPLDMTWNVVLIPITFIVMPIKYTFGMIPGKEKPIGHKLPGLTYLFVEVKLIIVCVIDLGLFPISGLMPHSYASAHRKMVGYGTYKTEIKPNPNYDKRLLELPLPLPPPPPPPPPSGSRPPPPPAPPPPSPKGKIPSKGKPTVPGSGKAPPPAGSSQPKAQASLPFLDQLKKTVHERVLPQPQSGPQPQPQTQPPPPPQSGPQPQSQPQPQTQPLPPPQPGSQPKPKPQSDPQPQPQPETKPGPQSQPKPGLERVGSRLDDSALSAILNRRRSMVVEDEKKEKAESVNIRPIVAPVFKQNPKQGPNGTSSVVLLNANNTLAATPLSTPTQLASGSTAIPLGNSQPSNHTLQNPTPKPSSKRTVSAKMAERFKAFEPNNEGVTSGIPRKELDARKAKQQQELRERAEQAEKAKREHAQQLEKERLQRIVDLEKQDQGNSDFGGTRKRGLTGSRIAASMVEKSKEKD